jgi:hypothetical protein
LASRITMGRFYGCYWSRVNPLVGDLQERHDSPFLGRCYHYHYHDHS